VGVASTLKKNITASSTWKIIRLTRAAGICEYWKVLRKSDLNAVREMAWLYKKGFSQCF